MRHETGQQRRKSRKHAQILAAALEAFKEGGFSKVSVSRIAQHAGVSPATIYNHFGDKHRLVEEVVSDVADSKVEAYRQILTSQAPWPERLRAVIVDKQTSLREFQGEFLKNLYREFPDLVRRIGELRPRIYDTIILPFLDEGRRLGYVSERASNEAVIAYLQLIQSNADRSSNILSRFDSNPKLFDQVYDLILHGLILNGPPGDCADNQ